MQDLTPQLTSSGGATAMAVNSANQVVGYYYPNGNSGALGFLWTQNGGLQNLGAAGTLAFGINDSGTVVGQTPVAKGYRHAFPGPKPPASPTSALWAAKKAPPSASTTWDG